MERSEALRVLGLEEGATVEEVRGAYWRKVTAWNQRRDYAMTPELERECKEQLRLVEEAARVLLPEGLPLSDEDVPGTKAYGAAARASEQSRRQDVSAAALPAVDTDKARQRLLSLCILGSMNFIIMLIISMSLRIVFLLGLKKLVSMSWLYNSIYLFPILISAMIFSRFTASNVNLDWCYGLNLGAMLATLTMLLLPLILPLSSLDYESVNFNYIFIPISYSLALLANCFYEYVLLSWRSRSGAAGVGGLLPVWSGSRKWLAEGEEEAWQVARSSRSQAAVREFLEQFPNGKYAAAARVKLQDLENPSKKVV